MIVVIEETGKEEELSMNSAYTSVDKALTLIGSTAALTDTFFWNEEKEAYEVSQEDFDWWKEYLEEYEAAEEKLNDFLEKNEDIIDIEKYYTHIAGVEFNDLPSAMLSFISDHTYTIIAEYKVSSTDTRQSRHTVAASDLAQAEAIVMGICGEMTSLDGDKFDAPLPVNCWEE